MRRLGVFLICFSGLCNGGMAREVSLDELNSSLLHAARQGDVVSFNTALSLGANLHGVDQAGNNAVLMAVEGEQHQTLRLLLDKGVNPNVRGRSGFTPLTLATMRGSEYDVGLLLKAGADPDLHNALGSSPLHLAVEFGRNGIMEQLLKAGARVEDMNALGETSLVIAIRTANTKAFEVLLSIGSEPNTRDKTGRCALFWAIVENHEGMALALIEKGARFDSRSDGYTPLRMAKILRQNDVVAALINRGATD